MKTFTTQVTRAVTDQEVEVVKSLSLGLRAVEIAPKLKLSHRTVEAKIDQIKKDYGAVTQAHLVGIFFRNNLIN